MSVGIKDYVVSRRYTYKPDFILKGFISPYIYPLHSILFVDYIIAARSFTTYSPPSTSPYLKNPCNPQTASRTLISRPSSPSSRSNAPTTPTVAAGLRQRRPRPSTVPPFEQELSQFEG
ncbi:uncharacterized protein BDZ99DRAFT_467177 [Mytilinidion resinicola]|uniref:Uncharacterized protein n=1 Tax=Mytilinidion resinicola TaxID=574789 RepID=A0A6A6YAC6_9PEZI|nr:uncharacterized protein BDZ99DRAFT_467177 [Mytilinidion resinicola]KAF2804954.1 hypothetical protein BDZ99DRAFT_467177 [Mytilinidion resinicola]